MKRITWHFNYPELEKINKRYTWAMIAASVIGAGGAIGSSMISNSGKKDSESGGVALQPDKTDWQLQSGKAVSDWALKYLKDYTPGAEYGGQFTAGMSPYETAGMSYLSKYLNQPDTGSNYALAADEIKKTLTGAYDPYTSPYYQSMRTGAMTEQEDAIDKLRRSQGYRGSFFQDTGVREEGRLREGTTNYLNQILGKLSETERQNRLSAVPMAQSLEQYSQGAALNKATAATTLGSLPRLIEQADLEAKYKDFLRKQDELKSVVNAAAGNFSTPISYGVQNYEQASSPFERIMAQALPALGNIAGNINWGGSGSSGGGAPAGNNAYTNFAATTDWGL